MRKEIARYLETRRELEGGLYLDDDVKDGLKRVLMTLGEYGRQISGCMKCGLGKTRKNFVFGKGNPHSKIVFIGEAPGAEEDARGIPFVGRAGKLLDEILKDSGFNPEDVYICNILKCRPPGNRDPLPDEIASCEPYLLRQIEMIKPKMIVAVGRIAAQTLLRNNIAIGEMRGNTYHYNGIPFFVIYHPAAVLRNSNLRKNIDQDMMKIRRFYEKTEHN